MPSEIRDSLIRLLDATGPSGFEAPAAAAWRETASGFADRIWVDVNGNSFAEIGAGMAPTVMLAGHIDEIGLMVHHVDDDGFLWVQSIGGWDPQVLVGQRVAIHTDSGMVPGVVGRKAIHLLKRDDGDKGVKLKELWIDIGAAGGDEARDRVAIGDVATIASDTLELSNDMVAARSIDNRVGAAVVLEALRLAKQRGSRAHVIAAATVQEEIGYVAGGGARTGAYGLDPQVGIVVDVTHATDHPTVDRKEHGDIRIGAGPVLARGAAINPVVFRSLRAASEALGVDVQVQAIPAMTGTDADAVRMSRGGVAVGLVSVANRYMHSPNQIVSMNDVGAAAELIAEFLVRLEPGMEYLPG
jgi:endoglucanase